MIPALAAVIARMCRLTARIAGALAVAFGLSGCLWAGAPDRLDRVSLRAGDAQERNITIHAVDPIPGGEPALRSGTDGKRVLGVIKGWYERAKGSTSDYGAAGAAAAETAESGL